MEAGAFIWMGFLSLCVVAMLVSFIMSLTRNSNGDAPQQPEQPTRIDVHVHMPTGDEIGAGMVRQLQQQVAARQIEARGCRTDWHVVQNDRGRLAVGVQPRLGNQRKEIVRR